MRRLVGLRFVGDTVERSVVVARELPRFAPTSFSSACGTRSILDRDHPADRAFRRNSRRLSRRIMDPSSSMISADDAGRIQAGELREIDRRFGLSGAHEHAGPRELAAETCVPVGGVTRSGLDVDQRRICWSDPAGDARRHATRASTETENAVPSGAVLSLTMFGSAARRAGQRASGTLISPPPSLRMKGLIASGVTSRPPSRGRPPFFAVLVVHDDHHLALRDRRDSPTRSSPSRSARQRQPRRDSAAPPRRPAPCGYDGSRPPTRNSEIAASVNPGPLSNLRRRQPRIGHGPPVTGLRTCSYLLKTHHGLKQLSR